MSCLNWNVRVCGQGTGIDLTLPSLHSAWKCNPSFPRLVARRGLLDPRVIPPWALLTGVIGVMFFTRIEACDRPAIYRVGYGD